MAPKRPPPDPPVSSSSETEENDSEEDDTGSESEKVEQPIDKKNPTQVSKSESKSNPVQSPAKPQPSSKSNPVQTLAKPQPSPDAGTDSDSESDSESSPSDHQIRPISSKPMETEPPSKKPIEPEPPSKKPIEPEPPSKKLRSKKPRPESETPVKPTVPAKRDIDINIEDKASRSKRAKKKIFESESEDLSKKSTDDSKKFQRLWSEEDEIVILNGIIEYEAKKSAYPWTDMTAFHDFIKKSVQAEVSKSQLVEKVRRLKKKYEVNSVKGNNPVFSKPHEEKAFELSKKIWGVEKTSVGEQSKPNGEVSKKNSKEPEAKTVVSSKKRRTSMVGNGVKKCTQSGFEIDWSKSKCLSESSQGVVSLRDDELKEGLELAGPGKYMELEMRWARLQTKETELYLERVALLRDQTQLVLESLRAKRH